MKTNNLKIIFLLISATLFSVSVRSQKIEWQQVLGGAHSEYLYDVKATPDYGFLLAGSSFSGKTGTKTEAGQGDLDYFLWKMDESGKMEWQKSFGGSGSDYLYSAALTKEGGYILGGSSDSPKSGDKKEDGFGNMDFWILKLNPEGKEEWQLTLGGIGNDQLQSIQQTADGGYIVGGSSDSSPIKDSDGKTIGSKTEESRGSMDYWVIRLSPEGQIEWEKTFGGSFSDRLKDILILEDGFLIAGTSNSPLGTGSKTVQHYGENDYWLIKLDDRGNEIWQKAYGGDGDDSLAQIISTENGYLIAGSSNSKPNPDGGKTATNGEGTDFWVVEIDRDGNTIWDATYDIGRWDVLVSVAATDQNEYLLSGYASSETLGRKTDSKGVNDYAVIKINSKGESLWQKTIGGMGSDQLKGAVQMRDGGYLLAGNSDSKKSDDKDRASIGGNDYWVVKLGSENKTTEDRKLVEVFPNPTYQYTNIVIAEDFREAKADVFDLNGRKLQTKELLYRSTPIDLQGYPPGVYIIKITIDGKTEEVKVLKKGSK
ncbi:MAG: T9SS type A sorting domain-containing protein [Weeksellaceae bacterium]